jgi:hypothetical protein
LPELWLGAVELDLVSVALNSPCAILDQFERRLLP